MVESHRSRTATPPESSRGCSCALLILTLLFVSAALTVGGFLAYKKHLEDNSLKKLSPAERHAFEQWLNAPLNIPTSYLEFRPPLPPEAALKRGKVYSDSRVALGHTTRYIQLIRGKLHTITHYQAMPTTEDEQLRHFVTITKPVVDQITQMAASAYYVANARTPLGSSEQASSSDPLWLTNHNILAETYLGNTAFATDALSTTLLLFRRDPEAGGDHRLVDEILTTTLVMSQFTTDPLVLTNMLQYLNSARGYFRDFQPREGYTMDFNMIQQMVENGYISNLPRTWREVGTISETFVEYFEWLKKKLPPHDPRAVRADELLGLCGVGHLSQEKYLKPFYIGVFKPFVRQLLFAKHGIRDFHYNFLDLPQSGANVRSVGARYDLARLALARRIARLTGKPIPTAPEDFVPHFMQQFPKDPFTSGPLQFSPDRDAFYSVGPDTIADTSDDLYFLDAPALTPHPQTR